MCVVAAVVAMRESRVGIPLSHKLAAPVASSGGHLKITL
jgi:hypothetical protein